MLCCGVLCCAVACGWGVQTTRVCAQCTWAWVWASAPVLWRCVCGVSSAFTCCQARAKCRRARAAAPPPRAQAQAQAQAQALAQAQVQVQAQGRGRTHTFRRLQRPPQPQPPQGPTNPHRTVRRTRNQPPMLWLCCVVCCVLELTRIESLVCVVCGVVWCGVVCCEQPLSTAISRRHSHSPCLQRTQCLCLCLCLCPWRRVVVAQALCLACSATLSTPSTSCSVRCVATI